MIWAVLGLFFFSCSNTTPESEKTYETYYNQGWEAFTQKEYPRALIAFLEAEKLNKTSDIVSAIGWVYLVQSDLEKAKQTLFQTGFSSINISAGLAFLYNATGDFTQSIQAVNVVENENSDWAFAYGLNLTMKDLYVVLAQNHFALGNFKESVDVLQKIDSAFTANPDTFDGQKRIASKIESMNKHIVLSLMGSKRIKPVL